MILLIIAFFSRQNEYIMCSSALDSDVPPHLKEKRGSGGNDDGIASCRPPEGEGQNNKVTCQLAMEPKLRNRATRLYLSLVFIKCSHAYALLCVHRARIHDDKENFVLVAPRHVMIITAGLAH